MKPKTFILILYSLWGIIGITYQSIPVLLGSIVTAWFLFLIEVKNE